MLTFILKKMALGALIATTPITFAQADTVTATFAASTTEAATNAGVLTSHTSDAVMNPQNCPKYLEAHQASEVGVKARYLAGNGSAPLPPAGNTRAE